MWRFGSSVVGYDAETGEDIAPPALAGFTPEEWFEQTHEPRRYGFHGTLKAPFRLAEGADETDLFAALARFAAGHHPFELPPLEVRQIGTFIALVPPARFRRWRIWRRMRWRNWTPCGRRSPKAEIARRKRAPLSARQLAYLHRYGYPYVREEFRFHMTLSSALAEPALGRATQALCDAYAPAGRTCPSRWRMRRSMCRRRRACASAFSTARRWRLSRASRRERSGSPPGPSDRRTAVIGASHFPPPPETGLS